MAAEERSGQAGLTRREMSLPVIDQNNIIPEYTTYFRSIIAFGLIHVKEDETEIKKAIEDLARV